MIKCFNFNVYIYVICRWFKHISDAADMYKSRTKSTQDSIDEINTVTSLNSSTSKEPLDIIVDKDIGTTVIPEQNNNISTILPSGTTLDPIIDAENSNEVESDVENCSNNNENVDDEKKTIILNNNTETDSMDDSAAAKEYSNNSNNTRTLTQQCSLVAPSEVQVSVSPALTADSVITASGLFFFVFFYFVTLYESFVLFFI